ncbi:MAG: hypothetical protein MUD09_10130, partial [Desulfobacterales bacterium]|nr:hypothetical protein [Desulfobacterales bacterium]
IEERLIEKSEQENLLNEKLGEASSEIRELVGFVRVSARDLEGNLNQSPQSAFFPDRVGILEAIKNEQKFPDMADIEQMASLLFEEIALSGAVSVRKGTIVVFCSFKTSRLKNSKADRLLHGRPIRIFTY